MPFIIYSTLATISILFGAAQPWVWSLYTAAMFAGFVVMLWSRKRLDGPGWLFWLAVLPFLAITLLQCVPLPGGLLEAFSPMRAQTLQAARALTDEVGGAASVAYQGQVALRWWGYLLAVVLFSIVLWRFCGERRYLKRVIWVLLAVGVFQALYGLVQALVPGTGVLWVEPFAYDGCARGTYINRNHFAGFLEMVWPLALAVTLSLGEWEDEQGWKVWLSEERANYQLLLFLMVALMLLGLLFSKSRAGIAGALIGCLTFVMLVRQGTGRFKWSFLVFLGIIVGLVAVYGSRMGFQGILDRFMALESGDGRQLVWKDSWQMVRDHFWGIGLHNYQFLEPVYVKSILSGARHYHAHNDYLQLLIETGSVGALVLVAGFFTFLIRSFRRVKAMGMQAGRFRFFVACGALSGLTSMAFHSFFDFNLQIAANVVYFGVLVAIVEACLGSRARSARA